MSLRQRISTFRQRFLGAVKSPTGKDFATYAAFVVVAFFFWLLMSLDNEVQRDFEVPLVIDEVPDSVTIVSNTPPELSVVVKGKGSQLIRFLLGSDMPELKIKFESSQGRDNQMFVPHARLDGRLREYFGTGVQIISSKPDSLLLRYTTLPGRKVKLLLDAHVTPDYKSVISGPLTANVDSVTVYSSSPLPQGLTEVRTEAFYGTSMSDTTRMTVRVLPLENMKIVPEEVSVTVPVEPIISKTRRLKVEASNVPEGKNLVVFPAVIEANYLIPMSKYGETLPFAVYVDYDDIHAGQTRLPIHVSVAPPDARAITFAPDSLEFIIEQAQ